jgi:fructokinase
VGAGDCFQAGLLAAIGRYGLIEDVGLTRPEWQRALAEAAASASLNVQRAGCQPPTWDEVREAVE